MKLTIEQADNGYIFRGYDDCSCWVSSKTPEDLAREIGKYIADNVIETFKDPEAIKIDIDYLVDINDEL